MKSGKNTICIQTINQFKTQASRIVIDIDECIKPIAKRPGYLKQVKPLKINN